MKKVIILAAFLFFMMGCGVSVTPTPQVRRMVPMASAIPPTPIPTQVPFPTATWPPFPTPTPGSKKTQKPFPSPTIATLVAPTVPPTAVPTINPTSTPVSGFQVEENLRLEVQKPFPERFTEGWAKVVVENPGTYIREVYIVFQVSPAAAGNVVEKAAWIFDGQGRRPIRPDAAFNVQARSSVAIFLLLRIIPSFENSFQQPLEGVTVTASLWRRAGGGWESVEGETRVMGEGVKIVPVITPYIPTECEQADLEKFSCTPLIRLESRGDATVYFNVTVQRYNGKEWVGASADEAKVLIKAQFPSDHSFLLKGKEHEEDVRDPFAFPIAVTFELPGTYRVLVAAKLQGVAFVEPEFQ